MYKISLNNLEFHSFHGFYQEENLVGNTFVVEIVVEINDFELGIRNEELGIEELGLTVDYVSLFHIAKEEMSIPRKLLETVVKSIHDRIKLLNPNIHSIEVSLTKKHVPVEGMVGEAQVSYKS